MRHAFLLLLTLTAALLAMPLPEALTYINASTDKDPLTYEIDEPIVFTVNFGEYNDQIPKGTKLSWCLRGDDGQSSTGVQEWDPAITNTIQGSLASNGFLWLHVDFLDQDGKKLQFAFGGDAYLTAGAAVHPELLQGVPAPADFDEYWDDQRQALLDLPLKTKIEPALEKDQCTVYKVTANCLGPRPMTAWLCIPKNAAEKSLPVVVGFHGYGFAGPQYRDPSWMNETEVIRMDVGAHGTDMGREQAYYDAFEKALANEQGMGYAFDYRENQNRDTAYFHGMALRVMRALQVAKTLPQWNQKDLIVEGSSQGGLQSIWAAALDPDVTLAKPTVPWHADIAGQGQLGRVFGPWKIPYTPALEYYDTIHMAHRIHCPLEITRAGLGDYVCPPSGIAVLYNNLKCPKTIHWFQGSDHGFVPKGSLIYTRKE